MTKEVRSSRRSQFIRDVILKLQDHLVGDWFTFGLHLNLEYEELQVIELNHLNWQRRFGQMIVKWIDRFGSGATWTNIVDALKKMKYDSLANEVEEEYI